MDSPLTRDDSSACYAIIRHNIRTFRRTYVESEQEPIRRSGGQYLGYFLPTDFAGSTREALGLIDLPTPGGISLSSALPQFDGKKRGAVDSTLWHNLVP